MPWLDDRGRLFGRINIIDLAVLLLVLLVAARLGLRSRLLRAVNPSTAKPVEAVLVVEDVRQATADAMQEGENVLNTKSNAVLGKLVKKEVRPALKEVETADGRLAQAESPFKKDVYLTIRGPGQVTPNVILMGGYEMRVGASLAVKGLKFAVNTTVLSVKVEE
ncbi:MAG TPA: DUF4330 domain-containing protein [Firmicutes bacterium]|nr:hypothetical protein [Bacillota bacterium]HHV57999.1 DUF4330 domain-containing protein [Bacillota bacterium]